MDFYTRKQTANLSHYGIRDEVDFDRIFSIKSSSIINKTELSKIHSCEKLVISSNQIKSLVNVPKQIVSLDCSANCLESLDGLNVLPEGLKILCCKINKLKNLDGLVHSLTHLDCSNNELTRLDNLPSGLQFLICSLNKIECLDMLPCALEHLICSSNEITSLDNLPSSLKFLDCDANKLKTLNNLPLNGLNELSCANTNITILNNLPKIDKIFKDKNVLLDTSNKIKKILDR